jgi:hypothetical protein
MRRVRVSPSLLRKPGRIDVLELRKEDFRLSEVVVDLLLGEIGEPVVPALVPEDGRELGAVGQRVFPMLGEEVLEALATCLDVSRGRRGGSRDRQAHAECSEQQETAHRSSLSTRSVARRIRKSAPRVRHLDPGSLSVAPSNL